MEHLSGKTILITGATDGLGKAVALELAKRDATLLIHGRNPQKGEAVLQEINKINHKPAHRYYNADFASLHQIRDMAFKVLAEHDRLHILINNAGIGAGKNNQRQLSEDGYELRFAVNYLASVLLTRHLLPMMQQSRPAKIINVSSVGQSAIDFTDIMMEHHYNGFKAYTQSKLAQVLFTFSLADELKNSGITVNCLHPASLMNTNMVLESSMPVQSRVEEGLDTVLYVTLSPETDKITGAYFDHHQQKRAHEQAYDQAARKKLKVLSNRLISNAFAVNR
jgi:NAD(P)-dependent dehydrogenase (short-subunit alcohol dehydrogenase family)